MHETPPPAPAPPSHATAFTMALVAAAGTALATKVIDWAWAKLTTEKPAPADETKR